MKGGVPTNQTHLALAVEHLKKAVQLAQRGRGRFFNEGDDLLFIGTEAELRKAYESINRLGASFWTVNPSINHRRVGEIRQLLTHDYAQVDRELVWEIATKESPALLHRLERARAPRKE